jgi:hypothetical protein
MSAFKKGRKLENGSNTTYREYVLTTESREVGKAVATKFTASALPAWFRILPNRDLTTYIAIVETHPRREGHKKKLAV